MNMTDPLDLRIREALGALRPDPETFAAGVEARIAEGEAAAAHEADDRDVVEARALPGWVRAAASFVPLPVLLGGVFKLTNNASPAVSLQGIRNKPEYGQLEMQRFIDAHGITDFEFNPHFPVITLAVMRGAVYALGTDYYDRYVDEIFRHMWADPKKMDDPEVIAAALEESGLPKAEILEATQRPEIKQGLMDRTAASVERGTFGSPTFFVNDDIYFGKDRLRDVEEHIQRLLDGAQ